MLSKNEFDKILKECRSHELECDEFTLAKETNSVELEKKEISSRIKPVFIRGCTNEWPKLEKIFQNLEAHSSEKRLNSVDNAALIGCNMIKDLTSGEFIHLSGIKSEDYLLKNYSPGYSGYQLSSDEEKTNIYYKKGNGLSIRGTALIIHGYEADNYGSFIFRCLPQLLLAKELKLDFDYFIIPKRTLWATQAISLLDFGVKPILAHNEVQGLQLEKCQYIQSFDNQGFFSSQDVRRIRTFCESLWQSSSNMLYENIYISRRWAPSRTVFTRNLTSEAAIMQNLEPLGYKEIHSQLHSFKDQVNIFMHAKNIIGTSGSGLLNSMFSPQNTKVLELESILACTTQHANIYSSTGKSFSFFLGTQNPKTPESLHPWSIDVNDFMHAVDHFHSY
jgi:capsular polysaccharide biosynthesis protein